MRYPGGKGGAGVAHTILREVPPHDVYIEAFAGSAALYRAKRPVALSLLVERNAGQAFALASIVRPGDEILNGDAIALLEACLWSGREFVYLDPPYVLSTRTARRLYGDFELSDAEHVRLLDVLGGLPVPFALSGYRCAIYDDASSSFGWRRVDFEAMTRGGMRTESLWMNYEVPAFIADAGYAGRDFRERQGIKRKASRWVARFKALPALERQAIVEQLVAAGIVGRDAAAAASAVTMRSCDQQASSLTMPAEHLVSSSVVAMLASSLRAAA